MRNRDEIKGRIEQIKGRAKRAAGELTGDERLKGRGAADELVGTAREGAGTVRRKAGEAIEDVGKKVKR